MACILRFVVECMLKCAKDATTDCQDAEAGVLLSAFTHVIKQVNAPLLEFGLPLFDSAGPVQLHDNVATDSDVSLCSTVGQTASTM
jgi:hypothetical protein